MICRGTVNRGGEATSQTHSSFERKQAGISSATRNFLVVLPLAFAVPGAVPLLPAVIVAQTVVELVASLAYMRVMPRMGKTEVASVA